MESKTSRKSIREQMLAGVVGFVRAVAPIVGVRRIVLVGSITTPKSTPKDIDLLVTVTDDADLAPLARCARQLQGRLQGLNHWADVFLADERGRYLGRTCTWRECKPGIRASCDALHCGRRPHLHDDLGDVLLNHALIASPPVEIWPTVIRRNHVPPDVEALLATIEHAV
jgi:predicted nucleotidyltransferase